MISRAITRLIWLFLSLVMAACLLVAALVYFPNTPLPDAWNPMKPLVASDKVTLLTPSKLRFAIKDFNACQRALDDLGVTFKVLEDKEVSDQCHIRDQVQIDKLSQARIGTLKTTCGTALRLAMWEYHVVQPTALDVMGEPVGQVNQLGSYNCRAIRSVKGPTERMSEHATANAVDISGFRMKLGKKFSLLKNWDGTPQEQEFLRRIRDGGCDFFRITLSPDYNSLHADHFHFDQGRWVSCR